MQTGKNKQTVIALYDQMFNQYQPADAIPSTAVSPPSVKKNKFHAK